MAEKKLILQCVHCHGETKLIVEVSSARGSVRGKPVKKIQIVRYCEHCNRPNILHVPEQWDESPLVLGDGYRVTGYHGDIPVIEGEPYP